MTLDEIKFLSSGEGRELIEKNINEKSFKVALKTDLSFRIRSSAIAEQISLLKKAKTKAPSFAGAGLVFSRTALEQASSETAAKYKSNLFSGKRSIDLTGGLGVDSIYLSKNFVNHIYCEKDKLLSELFKANCNKLNIKNIEINNCDGIEKLKEYPDKYFDLIYVDPSRREGDRRAADINFCKPNILENFKLFLKKTNNFLIKLAPAYDLTEAEKNFYKMTEITAVSVDGECKEVLICFKEIGRQIVKMNMSAVILSQHNNNIRKFTKTKSELYERAEECIISGYFYEPDPAIIKMRLSDKIAQEYNLKYIAKNSDYFISNTYIADFPGRAFKIINAFKYKPKIIKTYLMKNSINKANIARRDFPCSVDELKKKLKLDDGGDEYFFFTKDVKHDLLFIHCQRYFDK